MFRARYCDLIREFSPHDPLAMTPAIAILVACGIIAARVPAFRAIMISPSSALRDD